MRMKIRPLILSFDTIKDNQGIFNILSSLAASRDLKKGIEHDSFAAPPGRGKRYAIPTGFFSNGRRISGLPICHPYGIFFKRSTYFRATDMPSLRDFFQTVNVFQGYRYAIPTGFFSNGQRISGLPICHPYGNSTFRSFQIVNLFPALITYF